MKQYQVPSIQGEFYGVQELQDMGITLPKNPKGIFISKKASLYNAHLMTVNNYVRIDDFCYIHGNIMIGSFVHICAFVLISGGGNKVTLEDFVTIAPRASIFTASDDYLGETLTNSLMMAEFRNNMDISNIILKKHSIVGASSVILPTSHGLEEGVSVGAMSVLKSPTNSFGVYCGIPARRIAERKKNLLDLERKFLSAYVF
ncbi:transferase [Helicobacter monodelphidis]|uniref:acyltransferase n=1 Tax=Helicobacter sp. 15-1451 TaxID=2004995 RepID=UPI000DCB6173|nr:transferase [Helicobacter sp. 15-1451]RAX57067.1 transferase [Helicobacter sp. 15-1451]